MFMACGHVSTSEDGIPCCLMCKEITPLAQVVTEAPNLEGRVAKCYICKRSKQSSLDLPFFEYMRDRYDYYYCGCSL